MSDRATCRRIMIVEDDADTRQTLRFTLESLGHVVEEADDGLDGISRGLLWHPEIAVVDIDMPIFDGYEVARRLREALHDDVVLIALTGLEVRDRALAAGFDDILLKPIAIEHIVPLLDRRIRKLSPAR